MAVFKCKMCGASLDITDLEAKVTKCEYCGTSQTTPTFDDDRKVNLFKRAEKLRRASEFDKAAGVYESIVGEFPEESEAYWGLCLCKYGIEYVDDPATGKKVPTCHRTSFDSIFEDENFEQACENTNEEAGRVLRAEAKAIDILQKSILDTVQQEPPYDIFICYKETDANGERTIDSVFAQDIYDGFTAKGYKVFFARITLESKLGQAYEPYIFSALNSAKVMIVVGTSYENFNAVWVKNEWNRFLHMMEKDKTKNLIPCYKDIDAYDMPKEFGKLQAQDMGKIGYLQDLIRGVQKLIGNEASGGSSIKGGSLATVGSLLKRAEIYLSDGDWKNADSCCETVLDADPTNKEAYLKKMLASVREKEMSRLGNSSAFYRKVSHLKSEKAYRFADDRTKSELERLHRISHDKYNEETYMEASKVMSSDGSADSYRTAMGLFDEIKDYRDSATLSELCKYKIMLIQRGSAVKGAEEKLRELESEAQDSRLRWKSARRVFIFNSHGIIMIIALVLLIAALTFYKQNTNTTYTNLFIVCGLAYAVLVVIGLYRALGFTESKMLKWILSFVINGFTASAGFYLAAIIPTIMHLVRRGKTIKYNRELSEEADKKVIEQKNVLKKNEDQFEEIQNRIAALENKVRREEPVTV